MAYPTGKSEVKTAEDRREAPLRGVSGALNLRRCLPASTLFAPILVREGRAEPATCDVGPRSDPHSGGQQRDPRSGRPARAGWAALRQFRFWGERWSSGVRTIDHAAAAAPGERSEAA